MNILPFVSILILVISLLVSSFFQGHKETALSKIGFTGLTSAYRMARNSAEEEKRYKKKPPEKGEISIPFREKITDNSKFNLTPLINGESIFLEEVFIKLLHNLYANTSLSKDCKYDKLAKAIIQAAKNTEPPIKFEHLVLRDPNLQAIWYKMLKQTPDWPPFTQYVILREDKEAIIARKASIPLLKAFFGEEITAEILAKEGEPERKKPGIKKDELETILTARSFSKDHIGYQTKKIPKKTKLEKDPNSGITAKISYKSKNVKSSSETSSPPQEPK